MKLDRPKDSKGKAPLKKQDHHNKVWYKKFVGIDLFQPKISPTLSFSGMYRK